MDFDWNKALESLSGAWSSIEQSKANLKLAQLDARTTADANGQLVKDGQIQMPAFQQAMPWLLIGGGLLLVYVLVKK